MVSPFVQNFITVKRQQNNAPAPLYIKDAKPGRHLIQEGFIGSTASTFGTYYDCAKNFYKGMNGEGTDYSIGKVNDLAGLLGGLGIASILSTGVAAPVSRTMKFVGFGCWTAAMALWPKLFISAPIKKMTGVDINQEYVDSYGRRQRFFGDSQYLLWDLYSDEQINKIADKLKISKNIKNRRAATQEKMKQIAIQGNTLWMLTAGFATPIMATLMADQLQSRVVTPLVEKYRTSKNGKALENMAGTLSTKLPKTQINEQVEMLTKEALEKSKKGEAFADSLEQLGKIFKEVYDTSDISGAMKEEYRKITMELKKEYVELTPTIGNEFNQKLASLLGVDVKEVEQVFAGVTQETYKAKKEEVAERISAILEQKASLEDKVITEASQLLGLEKVEVVKFDEAAAKKLVNLAKMGEEFKQRKAAYNRYFEATLANIENSQTANAWQRFPKRVLRALGINGSLEKEIALGVDGALEGTATNPVSKLNRHAIIHKHLTEFVKDEVKVNGVVTKILEQYIPIIEKERAAAKTLIDNARANLHALKEEALAMSGFDAKEIQKTIELFDAESTRAKANENIKRFFIINEGDKLNSVRKDVETLLKYTSQPKLNPGEKQALKTAKQKVSAFLKANKENAEFKTLRQEAAKLFRADGRLNSNRELFEQLKGKLGQGYINIFKSFDKSLASFEISLQDKLRNTEETFFNLIKVLDAYVRKDKMAQEFWLKQLSVDNVTNKYEQYGVTSKTRFSDIHDRLFSPVSGTVKGAVEDFQGTDKAGSLKGKVLNVIDESIATLKGELGDIKNPIKPNLIVREDDAKRIQVFFDSLTQRVGKCVDDFIVDAARESVTYKKFLTVAGGAALALVGITAYSISQFGKKNQYNQDKYEYEGGGLNVRK